MKINKYFLELKGQHDHSPGGTSLSNTEDHAHDSYETHTVIGLSLVLGFVFMLLVDQIGSSHNRGKLLCIHLNVSMYAPQILITIWLSFSSHSPISGCCTAYKIIFKIILCSDPEGGNARSSRSFTATLGLVVHAAGTNTTIFYFGILLTKNPCFFS